MIESAVKNWEKSKDKIFEIFKKNHPESYKEIVKILIGTITSDDDYSDFNPDPERIHEIDDGNYQGTLVYVIGEKGYQPSDYFYVMVNYGSCSGCDTLQSIRGYNDETPTDEQAKQYQTLALHIVQGLKKMGGDEV